MGHFFRSMGVVPNVCYPFGVVLPRDYSKGGAVSNRALPLYFIQCITQCMPVSSKFRKKNFKHLFLFFLAFKHDQHVATASWLASSRTACC